MISIISIFISLTLIFIKIPSACMRQVLGAGTLGRPRGIGWRGRLEGGLGWGIRINPWLIHVNVWQKPLQYCKVISVQLIKINGKKKKKILSANLDLQWVPEAFLFIHQPYYQFLYKFTGVLSEKLNQGMKTLLSIF